MKNTFKKLVIAVLLITLCLPAFTACESMPLKLNKTASATVGTVGDFEVAYDELYFLVKSYRNQLDIKYGEDAYKSSKEITVTDDEGKESTVVLSEHYISTLKSLVFDNIVSNYAVLTLCEEAGISLDSETVQENIQVSVDKYIETDFNGSRSEYKKALEEQGITDNYVRFNIGVDLLYSGLVAHYLENGVLTDDEAEIKTAIYNEFVRTWHIMILNEDGSPDNLARAEEALGKIKNGTSMYKMIGGTYNDDLTLTTLDGYYFTRGSMDEAYEEAAYALDINEISDIVASVGKDSAGNQVDCYYIIQRLELEEAYIESNFEELKSSYHSSKVYSMIDGLSDSLKFTPNTYGETLDFLNLEVPHESDPVVTITVTSIVVGTILSAATICLIVFAVKKKKQKILALSAKNAKSSKGK
ncbi:MAG: SurA N-terminal domain-containing protein [Clostridia bacterium]|nr:SurA N-terminal domain-containing protein [Clostridia bacterium]